MSIQRPYGAGDEADSNEQLAMAHAVMRIPSPRIARTGELLDLIRREVAVTTSELATKMGVARSTVTERLELLTRHGLVVPAGERQAGRGRPPARMAFNPRAGITLAAQVGMSGTLVAVSDLAGEILWLTQVQLDLAEGRDALETMLEKQFTAGLAEVGEDLSRVHGIGIGMPGDIEIAAAGNAAQDPDDWAAHLISRRLQGVFHCPVFVDRDVNYLALGEQRVSWPVTNMMLSVKAGTVIVCGLVVDGKVVRATSGLFGEIGHSKVAGADAPCTCGGRGCLNTVAGGAALAAQLREQGHDVHTAREVAQLAKQGVVAAVQAVRTAGVRIGEVVASAMNLLNPEVITVWGYLADAGDQFLSGMYEAIYKDALPGAANSVVLERSRLGDTAGIRGAALTVIEHTLRPEVVDSYFTALAEG
ncbi:ROK family transcriptional regulator [Amycolatopsis jejuensis]|uniref:ROK family transcriptional regulator n=1 Tax=Amycolatopsis jejuensis TaxID=330084 RepID=UPI000B03CC4F|nr:ROK family transcriptional regulator [Amycolatopsis jejuensis]